MDPIAPYSALDKTLHKMVFSSPLLQEMLNDIEATLFKKSWANTPTGQPIFIAGLPRAGTTIILEALVKLPGLATHTYRDMPFILTPVLWNKLSKKFRKSSELKERAHGDGLKVNTDSPEAFEEVLWKKFFPNHYKKNSIQLWEESNKKFYIYFFEHIQKIAYLKSPTTNNIRYISKNNGNIARIPTIKSLCPDASILIPYRDPKEHAISLWKQHKNFNQRHEIDSFSKQYMADIGHYEFGSLHKPIEFPEFEQYKTQFTPDMPDYWLAYWLCTYRHLKPSRSFANFISYEALCSSPLRALEKICNTAQLNYNPEQLNTLSAMFKAAPKRSNEFNFDTSLLFNAERLHKELNESCLLQSAPAKEL